MSDTIEVCGRRFDAAALEGALLSHPYVAEAAVVGYPHPLKGEGIYAFVALRAGAQPSYSLQRALARCVRRKLGPAANPEHIQWVRALPRTGSGEVLRPFLRRLIGERQSVGAAAI